MRTKNHVDLMGNTGKEVTARFTGGGVPVTTFSIATNERFKDQKGVWQITTEWSNIVTYKRNAEIAGEFLRPGDPVRVVGKLKTRSWDDHGQKRYRTEVVAYEIYLLGAKDTPQAQAPGEDQGEYDDAPIDDSAPVE
jgi:single-strand DNA-binding protein